MKKKRDISLSKLSKQELIDVIIAQHNPITHNNRIQVSDFIVESTTEPLNKCKEVMDSLINKHRGFVTLRKTKAKVDNHLLNYTG